MCVTRKLMLLMVLVIFFRIYGQAGANTKIAYKCWCVWGGLLVLLVNTHMCVAKNKVVSAAALFTCWTAAAVAVVVVVVVVVVAVRCGLETAINQGGGGNPSVLLCGSFSMWCSWCAHTHMCVPERAVLMMVTVKFAVYWQAGAMI